MMPPAWHPPTDIKGKYVKEVKVANG
ncbi:hypothetical protein NM2004085_0029, partial [Neisseria meningitidis 2004085]